MKNGLRTIGLMMAIVLPGFFLAACDTGDDCEEADTSSTVTVASAHLSAGKSKPSKVKIHGSDDCEDDD